MTKQKTARNTRATAAKQRKGMSQAEFGRHVDVSQQRVQQLLASGTITAMTNGKIDPDVARIQYVRAIRRSPGSEEARRVAAARAAHIELQTARERNELILFDDVQTCVAEIISTFSRELAGVAAASTRDLPQRETIQTNLNAAIERCKRRLDGMCQDAAAGRPLGGHGAGDD